MAGKLQEFSRTKSLKKEAPTSKIPPSNLRGRAIEYFKGTNFWVHFQYSWVSYPPCPSPPALKKAHISFLYASNGLEN